MSWHYDAGYFHFKLNLIITQLEYVVDRVMVPLNRVFPNATTFAGMGRPLFVSFSCLWSVPPSREGYGHVVPGTKNLTTGTQGYACLPGQGTARPQPCEPVVKFLIPGPHVGSWPRWWSLCLTTKKRHIRDILGRTKFFPVILVTLV